MFRTEVIVDNATGLDDIEAGEAVWRKHKSLNDLILALTLVIWIQFVAQTFSWNSSNNSKAQKVVWILILKAETQA